MSASVLEVARPKSVQFPQPHLTAASANLDFLRAIAVMFVFVDHLFLTMGIQRIAFFSPADLGRVGVYFFFVHTCLVLLMSLERTPMTGLRRVLHFYFRRMFRIYPLAVFFVLLVYLCNVPQDVWGSGTAPHDLHTILGNLLLAQNVMGTACLFGPLWSLPLEVQMYLILPLVFYLVRRISQPTLLLMWAASVIAALAYLPFRSTGHVLWRLEVIVFVPCFLGGAVAYQVAQRSRPLLPGWLWPVTILAVLNVYLAFERQRYGWIACLLLGLSVPFFAQIQHEWLTRAAKWIATYSYGIYLSNIVILWFAFRICARWMPRFIVWSVFVAGAIFIPVACFHWIEKPLMKMGGTLADRFFRIEAA